MIGFAATTPTSTTDLIDEAWAPLRGTFTWWVVRPVARGPSVALRLIISRAARKDPAAHGATGSV